jgi:CRISPR/Cas system CSM-associated protein Csm3 (group 7 of RAMP superfamily)
MTRMKATPFIYRFIARIEVKAVTPLAIGTGKKDIITDALVATDCNNLPYIPATSIAGILRHELDEQVANNIFGNQTEQVNHGSHIMFTDAKMIGENGYAIDGLCSIDFTRPYYQPYHYLPIRQHNAMNDKGVTKTGAKFDNQVVIVGTRFCFEVEMVAKTSDQEAAFKDVLSKLSLRHLRIGGGTRKGYGEIEVCKCLYKKYNLTNSADLQAYIDKSSSLSAPFAGETIHLQAAQTHNGWDYYEVNLKADDFFIFGSGFGDDDVDDTPLTEQINGRQTSQTIIPASSIKGAISHRVAYYYNKLNSFFIDDTTVGVPEVGCKNTAVARLFGEDTNGKSGNITRGNVIISDVILEQLPTKVIKHVKLDRFTGGAFAGALYDEKVNYGGEFQLKILVNKQAFADDTIRIAFEKALVDLTTGILPLGGMTNRGHGCFSGTINRNGQPLNQA